jgi:hypothetical protein
MKAATYARVSTFDQELENQLAELRRYVEARGWTAVEFVDRGVSGSKARPMTCHTIAAIWRISSEGFRPPGGTHLAERHRLSALLSWRALPAIPSHKHVIDPDRVDVASASDEPGSEAKPITPRTTIVPAPGLRRSTAAPSIWKRPTSAPLRG